MFMQPARTLSFTPVDVSSFVQNTYFGRLPQTCDLRCTEAHRFAQASRRISHAEIDSEAGAQIKADIGAVLGNSCDGYRKVTTGEDATLMMRRLHLIDPNNTLAFLRPARDHCRSILFTHDLMAPYAEVFPHRYAEFAMTRPGGREVFMAGRSEQFGPINDDCLAIGRDLSGAEYYVGCDGMGGHIGGDLISAVTAQTVSWRLAHGDSFSQAINFAANVWRDLWGRFQEQIIVDQLVNKCLMSLLQEVEQSDEDVDGYDDDVTEYVLNKGSVEKELSRWICQADLVNSIAEALSQRTFRSGASSEIDDLLTSLLRGREQPIISPNKMPGTTLVALKKWRTESGTLCMQHVTIGDSRILVYGRKKGSTDPFTLIEQNVPQTCMADLEPFREIARSKGATDHDEIDRMARLYQRRHPMTSKIVGSFNPHFDDVLIDESHPMMLDAAMEYVTLISTDGLTGNVDEYTEIPLVLRAQQRADFMIAGLQQYMTDKRSAERMILKKLRKAMAPFREHYKMLRQSQSPLGALTAEDHARLASLDDDLRALWDQYGNLLVPESLRFTDPSVPHHSGPFYIAIDGIKYDDSTQIVVMM